MTARRRAARLAVLLAAAGIAAACGRGDARADAPLPFADELPDVFATIDDEPVTLADIRARAGDELDRLDAQYRRSRSRALETALFTELRERLRQTEARARGMTVEQLVFAEAGGAYQPSDADIALWYETNRDRLGGRPLDELREQIRDHLRDVHYAVAGDRLDDRLAREHGVVVHFEPYRARFDNSGAGSLGRAGAPVEIVEFSDFQCPFCRRFAPTMKRVAEEFGDQVHVVYRHMPISQNLPESFRAAEATLCAREQGRFWEMHDILFAEPDRLADAELKEKARRIGLDGRRFDTCLDAERFADQVRHDLREAAREGVTGTPAVFVNGRALDPGAVPYEVLVNAVRSELARVRAGR